MYQRKTVLITGANTGLGHEIVRALCATEIAYEIFVGGRSLAKAELAIRTVTWGFQTMHSHLRAIQIDLEGDNSVTAANEAVSRAYGTIDGLINNGERWTKPYDINVTGIHIMTHTFAPLMLKSSYPRLMFITSGVSLLEKSEKPELPWNKSPGTGWPKPPTAIDEPSYRRSKATLNMSMREWCRYLKEDGVKVWFESPGYLATGLGGSRERNARRGALDPAIGGRFVRSVLEGRRDGDVGKVVHYAGAVQPW